MKSARTLLCSPLTTVFLLTAILAAAAVHPAMAQPTSSANEKSTTLFYEKARTNPLTLRGFIAEMPKGADVRVRLSESIYPEEYLNLLEQKNFCIMLPTYFPVPPINERCRPGTMSATKFFNDEEQYHEGIKQLSQMSKGEENPLKSLEDVKPEHLGFLLGALTTSAAYQKLNYIEVLIPWFPNNLNDEAEKLGWNGTPEKMYPSFAALLDKKDLAATKELLDKVEAARQKYADEGPVLSTKVRYIVEVERNQAPEIVFAQLLYAFKSAAVDPRFVGVSLSGDENAPIALHDYKLHMEMLEVLTAQASFSNVKAVVSAGFLAQGIVQPRQFKDRIRMPVTLGNAKRISHGSSIMHENRPFELLATLKKRDIPVEIALTSEDVKYSITGLNNPFPVLLEYNVPVVLVTENGGLNRTDITNEYSRAVVGYNLSYGQLKQLVRNSLEYSLLTGKSIWESTTPYVMGKECRDSLRGKETGICKKLLNESEKAQEQWQLEGQFVDFERSFAVQPPVQQ